MSTAPGSPYQPPQSDMNPAPKSRSRGLLMGLGIGCGLLLLLCCGGVGGVFWFVKSSINDDPNVVRKIAAEIAEVPLPADFKPRYSIDMPFGFQGAKMKGVVYEGKDDSVFMMGEYNAEMTEAERDQVVQQMRQNFRMQGGAGNDKLDILETKSLELTMRGKPAKFKFAKA
ncbi:MAG TPA: hypothetical protein VHY20_11095, partial [Pirellulales bacterium]|nr:hypothetical protein [Pirellulales bacterium]